MFRAVLIAAAASAALAACAPTTSRHGFQTMDAAPKDVKVGEDTKSTVLERLGSPSVTSAFDQNTWYYVSQTTSRYTYHQPRVDERQVTMVVFDPASEKVTEVKNMDLEDGKTFALNDRETPTRGRQMSVLEQLLGNVGRTTGVFNEDRDRTPGQQRRD